MLSTRRGLHQGPSLGTLKLREGSLTPLITTVSLWLLALSRVPVTRRSVGVTLSAMKSNQWWHSITPHSAVATSARLRARVVQSCHQDTEITDHIITLHTISLHLSPAYLKYASWILSQTDQFPTWPAGQGVSAQAAATQSGTFRNHYLHCFLPRSLLGSQATLQTK